MTTPTKADASRLGVVVLGASSFPGYEAARGLDNPAFGRSAAAFRELIADPATCLRGPPAILDLFDSPLPVADVVIAMQDFLKANRAIEDLVIYYCGHGGMLRDNDRSYFLLLHSTNPRAEGFTGLAPAKMRTALDFDLISKRVFFLLDCCYSARAVEGWMSTSIGDQIEAQVLEKFPREGTAMITASSKGKVALAGTGEHTIFTGTLLDTLRTGVPSHDGELSFRNVFEQTRVLIEQRYGEDASRPEIHVPVQTYGDISSSPFFHNRALDNRPILPSPVERNRYDAALPALDMADRNIRRAALELIAELYAAARSPTFRDEIRSKFEELSRTHDSAATRDDAAALLARMPAPEPVTDASAADPMPPARSQPTTAPTAEPDASAAPAAIVPEPSTVAAPPSTKPPPVYTPPAYTPPRDDLLTMLGKAISGIATLAMIWLFYFVVTHLSEIWDLIPHGQTPDPAPIVIPQFPSIEDGGLLNPSHERLMSMLRTLPDDTGGGAADPAASSAPAP